MKKNEAWRRGAGSERAAELRKYFWRQLISRKSGLTTEPVANDLASALVEELSGDFWTSGSAGCGRGGISLAQVHRQKIFLGAKGGAYPTCIDEGHGGADSVCIRKGKGLFVCRGEDGKCG
jgi:hypothetical protein